MVPCQIDDVVSTPVCNDNGTPFDPSDDTYTFQVTVVSSGNCGSGWNGGGRGCLACTGAGGGGASDVRVGGTTLNDRKVVGAGGGGVAEVGLKCEGLRVPRAGRGEVDGDEGGVINLNADLFNGRDEDVAIAVFSKNRREKPHQFGASDGRAEVKPRPVAGDAHVQIAAVWGIPQVNRR